MKQVHLGIHHGEMFPIKDRSMSLVVAFICQIKKENDSYLV